MKTEEVTDAVWSIERMRSESGNQEKSDRIYKIVQSPTSDLGLASPNPVNSVNSVTVLCDLRGLCGEKYPVAYRLFRVKGTAKLRPDLR